AAIGGPHQGQCAAAVAEDAEEAARQFRLRRSFGMSLHARPEGNRVAVERERSVQVGRRGIGSIVGLWKPYDAHLGPRCEWLLLPAGASPPAPPWMPAVIRSAP